MSHASKLPAGILFVLVPTIEYGGTFLLSLVSKRAPGYLDNPVRQALFRAGHAHAGVLVILALVGLLWVDQTSLSEAGKAVARWTLFAAPLLVSAGFFFSVLPAQADRPNGIALVYIGAAALAVGVVLLGKGLLLAGAQRP
jgi:hypothetical protein